jgi:hypothetical protein
MRQDSGELADNPALIDGLDEQAPLGRLITMVQIWLLLIRVRRGGTSTSGIRTLCPVGCVSRE